MGKGVLTKDKNIDIYYRVFIFIINIELLLIDLQGLGFRVWGLGFRVQGLGFWVLMGKGVLTKDEIKTLFEQVLLV